MFETRAEMSLGGGANVVIFSERLEGENRIEVNEPEGSVPRNRSSWDR